MARIKNSTKKQRINSKPSTVKSISKKVKQASSESKSVSFWQSIKRHYSDFLLRRPHRSFQKTRRRDYARSLDMPGYWAFTLYVVRTLLSQKKLFGLILLFYVAAGVLLVGLASQDTYSQFSSLIDETAGSWDTAGKAGLLLLTSLSGGLNSSLTDVQQIYSGILLLLVWLAVVWALRALLAGNTPKLRDSLYNSGAPIVSTAIVLLIIVVQLVPIALAVVIINTGIGTGMFDSPTMSLILSVAAVGFGVLSIYWVTSSLIALVIVTLPGMYPWRAIQTAGDLVIGRRIRVLLRLCWMFVCALIFSVVILLLVILIDYVLKQALPAIEWVPIVPVVMAFISASVLIWSASYIYLLYRKIVEDDSKPA